MKKTQYFVTIVTLLTLSASAGALELMVINDYDSAADAAIWKKAKTDQVPERLLQQVSVSSPGAAYASVFPKTFLQEEQFAVCQKNCDQDLFRLSGAEIDKRDRAEWDVIEQTNVYFWLKKYFLHLEEEFNFKPAYFLKVTTNRELRDETKGKQLKNNAFFNPQDITLSFLPASKNLLFKLLGGKINRSGFDPSVVSHEASHYFFHHLFPNPINDNEISGLNEGFADYIANGFLNNPKVGLVMMHGETIRDSGDKIDKEKKLKTYEPGMEAHALGERVAYALWKTREVSQDKIEFDRLVIDAVRTLARNPYSTVHDFKLKMLERIPTVVAGIDFENVRTLWELTFTGGPTKLASTTFLNDSDNSKVVLGIRQRQTLPENLAREYGVQASKESHFMIHQLVTLSATQMALLLGSEKLTKPYWVALDLERKNVLGVFDTNKTLVTDQRELSQIKFLAEEAKGAGNLMKEFEEKVKAFSDLTNGKGDFSLAYKVSGKTMTQEQFPFNGVQIQGAKLRLDLKRRLLARVLLGIPDIESIELFLAPVTALSTLPEIAGQRVIGYRMSLKTGTTMEVMIDRAAN